MPFDIPREDAKATNHIGPLKDEKMKTFAVIDGQSRVVILYEAVAHTQHMGPCLATIYQYDTGSLKPQASREKEAAWNSAWDFDVPVHGEA